MNLNRTVSGGVFKKILEYRWKKSVLQAKKELPNLKIDNLVNAQYLKFSKQWGSMHPVSSTSNLANSFFLYTNQTCQPIGIGYCPNHVTIAKIRINKCII